MVAKLKPPRILNLLAESRPEENEVKSEAAFQRLLASCSDLPLQPRTPRAPSDRGRYPEEVGDEEVHGVGLPSDDDDDDDVDAIFVLDPQGDNMAAKPCTPAQSVNGDDPPVSLMGSPMVMAMDVDAVWACVSRASIWLMFFLAVDIAINNFNTSLCAVAVHSPSNHECSPLK